MKYLLLQAEESSASNRRVRQAAVLAQTLGLEMVLMEELTGSTPMLEGSIGNRNLPISQPSTTRLAEDRFHNAEGIYVLSPTHMHVAAEIRASFPYMHILMCQEIGSMLRPEHWLLLGEGRMTPVLPSFFQHLSTPQISRGVIQGRGEGWLRMEIRTSRHKDALSRYHFPEENLIPILNKHALERGIKRICMDWEECERLEGIFSSPQKNYYPQLANAAILML